MTKISTLLIGASALTLAACGGADVEERADYETDAEVSELATADQPPLEGDEPFSTEREEELSELELATEENNLVDEDDVGLEDDDEFAAAPTYAGSYDLAFADLDEPATLVIDSEPLDGEASGSLNGAPVLIAFEGEEMTFDAPLTMDGEEEIMTFTAMYADGLIRDGMAEAQGDGQSLAFTGERAFEDGFGMEEAGQARETGEAALEGDMDGDDLDGDDADY